MSYDPEINKKYLRERYAAQRQMCFEYKNQYNCIRCGSVEELQFDHIDPSTKEIEISALHPRSRLPELLLELDKCQVLCRECHQTKTAQEFSDRTDSFTHGTLYAHRTRKCQCSICLDAKDVYNAMRRMKRTGTLSYVRGPYNLPANHGTTKMYKRGCRCQKCKSAHAKAVNKYRNW